MNKTKQAFWAGIVLATASIFSACSGDSLVESPTDEAFDIKASLKVVVQDAWESKSLQGASVMLNGSEGAATDADGATIFKGLTVGTHSLKVQKEGYASVATTSDIGGGSVGKGTFITTENSQIIMLYPLTASLEGLLFYEGKNSEKKPAVGAVVQLIFSSNSYLEQTIYTATVNANGSYVFNALPAVGTNYSIGILEYTAPNGIVYKASQVGYGSGPSLIPGAKASMGNSTLGIDGIVSSFIVSSFNSNVGETDPVTMAFSEAVDVANSTVQVCSSISRVWNGYSDYNCYYYEDYYFDFRYDCYNFGDNCYEMSYYYDLYRNCEDNLSIYSYTCSPLPASVLYDVAWSNGNKTLSVSLFDPSKWEGNFFISVKAKSARDGSQISEAFGVQVAKQALAAVTGLKKTYPVAAVTTATQITLTDIGANGVSKIDFEWNKIAGAQYNVFVKASKSKNGFVQLISTTDTTATIEYARFGTGSNNLGLSSSSGTYTSGTPMPSYVGSGNGDYGMNNDYYVGPGNGNYNFESNYYYCGDSYCGNYQYTSSCSNGYCYVGSYRGNYTLGQNYQSVASGTGSYVSEGYCHLGSEYNLCYVGTNTGNYDTDGDCGSSGCGDYSLMLNDCSDSYCRVDNGNYDLVTTYNYVGAGSGSYVSQSSCDVNYCSVGYGNGDYSSESALTDVGPGNGNYVRIGSTPTLVGDGYGDYILSTSVSYTYYAPFASGGTIEVIVQAVKGTEKTLLTGATEGKDKITLKAP